MLQLSRSEYNMNNIGIDQLLCNRYSLEQKCMNNIKNIYQHAGKSDYQQNLKDIIDAAMVSTTEVFTNNSPNVHMTSTQVKKPSARKSLCLFTNILDVNPKTEKFRIVAAEEKRRAMKVGNIQWTQKKRKGHSKIYEQIERNLYAWITRHPQAVQSPISKYCLKVMLNDKKEPQLVPKLLLQVSAREMYNSLVRDPNDGDIKYSRDEDGNIIISDSTLCSLFPPQFKKMSTRYNIIFGCECCISAKIIHSSCYHGVIGI